MILEPTFTRTLGFSFVISSLKYGTVPFCTGPKSKDSLIKAMAPLNNTSFFTSNSFMVPFWKS